ncbi:hypothetical protein T265_07513 [Opisthorchis viverrini]|uniref:Uncharacterized protein n=1 Tax=Opisthorchis viverrini TaxID=6198 RepID=A0A074ZCC5_OPIVI|nr:hypothetical protein T265_07513 [Opisthorchis viverrini]KER24951.1 hypothetical protein T265_07513 [Opisthorchis viverrini]
MLIVQETTQRQASQCERRLLRAKRNLPKLALDVPNNVRRFLPERKLKTWKYQGSWGDSKSSAAVGTAMTRLMVVNSKAENSLKMGIFLPFLQPQSRLKFINHTVKLFMRAMETSVIVVLEQRLEDFALLAAICLASLSNLSAGSLLVNYPSSPRTAKWPVAPRPVHLPDAPALSHSTGQLPSPSATGHQTQSTHVRRALRTAKMLARHFETWGYKDDQSASLTGVS